VVRDGFAGVTEMDVSVVEVRVVVPAMPPKLAVMMVEPAETADANPLELPVVPTTAIAVSAELHVAMDVRFWVAPFDRVPVA